jgi:histone acetyltransferase
MSLEESQANATAHNNSSSGGGDNHHPDGATTNNNNTTTTATDTTDTTVPPPPSFTSIASRKRTAEEISPSETEATKKTKTQEQDPPGQEDINKTNVPLQSNHNETETSTAAPTNEKKEAEDDSATTTVPSIVVNTTTSTTTTDADAVATDTSNITTTTNNKNTTAKNPYEALKYIIVRNDGKSESMVKLIGLKSLFAKQLPKMPRPYIARLVLDRRHTSLAILSENPDVQGSDEEIIGGICYRAFPEMRFAEIAFCAVNATHQVKGYGTKLMNLLKQMGAETGLEYFITYADNYAIGYFKKQGFSKTIQMSKNRYKGYIKDYDGGTPMECYIHPSIDFTRIPEMLTAQRQFLLDRIALHAQSQTIYPPLDNAKGGSSSNTNNMDGNSTTTTTTTTMAQDGSMVLDPFAAAGLPTVTTGRGQAAAARALAIPGMRQAGWTLADVLQATGVGKEADKQKMALKSELLTLVRKIDEQQFAWPFREPVDTEAVPDYLDIIKEPIDLSTIEKRIRQENYYKSKQMLFSDLMLMINNCKLFNTEGSIYVQCAVSLETYIGTLFRKDSSNGVSGGGT